MRIGNIKSTRSLIRSVLQTATPCLTLMAQLAASPAALAQAPLDQIRPATLAHAAQPAITSSAEPDALPVAQSREIPLTPSAAVRKHSAVNAQGRLAAHRYFLVLSDKDAIVAAQENSIYDVQPTDAIQLKHGELLIQSKKELRIEAGGKDIYVSGGAIALVQVSKESVKVTNLTDFRKNSIRILAGNRRVLLWSGTYALFTAKIPSLAQVFSKPRIGQRYITSRVFKGLGCITLGEISLPELIANEPLLLAFCRHGHTRREQALIGQVLKTAVALKLAMRNRAQFQYGQPYQLAAHAN